MSPERILVAQGGGPTAVINQSLVGLVLQARRFGSIERVYGARHGVRGIVDEDLCDLGQETTHNLERVAATPASALGSTRDKPDEAYCREIFKVLQAHAITQFHYIGGNDSSDTVRIVSEQARSVGYALRCIHIPKTIDNDLVLNDHTPGFPSAARFVAQAFAGANLDNAALPGVYVGVVMGRHAGFLTAASALGAQVSGRRASPDLPARTRAGGGQVPGGGQGCSRTPGTVRDRGIRRRARRGREADRRRRGQGDRARRARQRAVVGKRRARRTALRDHQVPPGIKRVRGDTFGYLQRSFFGCVSEVDQREAREVGEKAVQFAMGGDGDGSVDHPARRLLRGRLRAGAAGRYRRQDAPDGRRFHLGRRRRHHGGVSSPTCVRWSVRGCRTRHGCAPLRCRARPAPERLALLKQEHTRSAEPGLSPASVGMQRLGPLVARNLPEALVLRDHLRAEQEEGCGDLQAQHHHDRRGQRAVHEVDL